MMSVMIPQLKEGQPVKEWRQLFEAAVQTIDGEASKKINFIPYAVQRNPVDCKWALEAIKKTTLKGALDHLEERLEGKKSKLVLMSSFYQLKPKTELDTDNKLSEFFFQAKETGNAAGMANEHIAFKFLEFVNKAEKVYSECKDKINSDMTDDDLMTIFDAAKAKVVSNTAAPSQMRIKEEVFLTNATEEALPTWAKQLQAQMENISKVLKLSSCDSSSSDKECQTVHLAKESRKRKSMRICSICGRKNHTEKECYQRVCSKCTGKGHDPEECPTQNKHLFRPKKSK